jgi:hypothetical protein
MPYGPHSRLKVTEDIGNHSKWVVRYYEPDMKLWFDHGDPKDTREKAEARMAKLLAEQKEQA